jgi:hypothetical protein
MLASTLECAGPNCWDLPHCPYHDARYSAEEVFDLTASEEGWDRLPQNELEVLREQWLERHGF